MKLIVTSKKWINTEPIDSNVFCGNVVLVHFWTSSCVNCIKSFPRLRELYNKYKDKKFVLIGIHTPQFEFEKNPEYVEQTVIDNNIYWPIMIDNDHINWRRFKNKYWPTVYLADKKGDVVYCHMGEGGYARMEKIIHNLIIEKSRKVKFSQMSIEKTNNICFSPTPDICCGYVKGLIANNRGYISNKDAVYVKPKKISENKMALSGEFLAASEFIQPQREGSSIYLNFTATEINLTMEPFGKEAIIEVGFEGNLFPNELKGNDVDNFGRVLIKEYRAYNILKANFPSSGVLSITLIEGKFKAFNFAFSGCVNRCDNVKV